VTSYSLRSASPAKTRSDVVVVGMLQSKDGPTLAAGGEDVGEAFGRQLRPLLATLGAKGAVGEVHKVPTGGRLNSPLLVLVGLGKDEPSPSMLRRASGVASRAIPNAASVALALPAATAAEVRAVTEGWLLGSYRFTTYKRDTAAESTAPGNVTVLSPGARKSDISDAFERAQIVAAAVSRTRDWVNEPPGQLTPPLFADAVSDEVRKRKRGRGKPKVTIEVHDVPALAELGCGGILAVGAGSSAPPRLVELSYQPKNAVAHLAFVGKGITFDSGGLTIKTAAGMVTMKCDMAGAAAVIQATLTIAELGLPVRISTFAPMAENMINGSATRPGDVVTMYGGRTVEVTNTDAEGRLVLADALVRAGEQDPDLIIDVATLTGAMVVALGERVAGVMGSEDVSARLVAAGDVAGEVIWPMPIPEEMSERVTSSKIADLAQHDWVRWGGGLFAAAFLREFVGSTPWGHLDVAGPAFNSGGPWGHVTSGGTGFAVATLVDLAEQIASEAN
jgi:leucyl aminopeptidase